MPSCLFIGGPLDGELREIERNDGWYEPRTVSSGDYSLNYDHQIQTARYQVGNGIARHESLTEAQVAQRLATNYGKPDKSFSENLGVLADRLDECGGEWAEQANLCRLAADLATSKLRRRLGVRCFGHELYVDADAPQVERIKYRLEQLIESRNENLGILR